MRAIAVLSVILFHIDKSLVPGGFVGVDVFFVISGYLISLQILRGLQTGSFSLLEFYRRRVKRIAPAMLVVVAVVLLASQLLLRPEDAERAARSAFWSVLSLGNVYFWRSADVGYFASASSELPLLHLWSLGVEEQFYVLWPLTLLFLKRWLDSRWLMAMFLVATVASFFAAQSLSRSQPDFSYYMLPTRAGELLIGALVAMRDARRVRAATEGAATWCTPLSALGLALIVAALVFVKEGQVFPGWRAFVPTLGTALVILAGSEGSNAVSRLLSLKPLVVLGLISYSAYLWHWPLLAFYRYGHAELPLHTGLLLLVLTLALAALSYRFVETPGRRYAAGAWATVFRQYAVPAAALAALAFVAVRSHGFALYSFVPGYEARLSSLQAQTRPAYDYDYVCQRQVLTDIDLANPKCVHGASESAAVDALLWGDSHAAHYVGVIASIAEAEGFRVRNVSIGACPPLLGDPMPFVVARRLEECRASLLLLQKSSMTVPVFILGANWTAYQAQSPDFMHRLQDTVDRMIKSGKKVILLGQVPHMTGFDRLCEEKALSYPGLECKPFTVAAAASVPAINEQLRAIARANPAVQYFDVEPYLCPRGACTAWDERGTRRYFDEYHLSLEGSWQVGRNVVSAEGVPPAFTRVFGKDPGR